MNSTPTGLIGLRPRGKSGDNVFAREPARTAERAARAYAETLEATTSIQVYGEPSDAVLEVLRRQAGAGVPMNIKRQHLGGFTRVQGS